MFICLANDNSMKYCTTNLHMRLFFLTHSLIGSVNDRRLILTNQQQELGSSLSEINLVFVALFLTDCSRSMQMYGFVTGIND